MCLILLSFQDHPESPLLLAGNRDEFYARPTAPPHLLNDSPRIWGGKDLSAGGTWMGVNENGLMAAITNRYGCPRPPTDPPRSRGEIVMGLLARESPEAAAGWLEGLNPADYRPYTVLFGSPLRFYCHSSLDNTPPVSLAPGCYALSNAGLNDVSWPKVARSLAFWKASRRLPGEALIGGLQRFLRNAQWPEPVLGEEAFVLRDVEPSGAGLSGPSEKTGTELSGPDPSEKTGTELSGPDPSEKTGTELSGPMGAVFIRTETFGTRSSAILTAGGRLGLRYYYADEEPLIRSLGRPEENPFRRVPLEG
ncbi:MAG: NRDE family protein [Deltaproteobacteria bacterium]|nr:NRDE family protein [Deltaproteobacteria bacterium]